MRISVEGQPATRTGASARKRPTAIPAAGSMHTVLLRSEKVKSKEEDKERAKDKKPGMGQVAASSSNGEKAQHHADEDDVMDATVSDDGGGRNSDTSEEMEASISRLIKKTATAVGRECEARWEKKVLRMIETEAVKRARKFQEERRTTDEQLRGLEERLRAEIKASKIATQTSAAPTSAAGGDSQRVDLSVGGAFRRRPLARRDRPMVDSPAGLRGDSGYGRRGHDALEMQNNRVLTTQFVVPLTDGSSHKEAWVLKKAMDQCLQGTPETRVHGHVLRWSWRRLLRKRRDAARAGGCKGCSARCSRRSKRDDQFWHTPTSTCSGGGARGLRPRATSTGQGVVHRHLAGRRVDNQRRGDRVGVRRIISCGRSSSCPARVRARMGPSGSSTCGCHVMERSQGGGSARGRGLGRARGAVHFEKCGSLPSGGASVALA